MPRFFPDACRSVNMRSPAVRWWERYFKVMKLGFVGLGQMGAPMAQNLVSAGHEVTVYNRSQEKADALAKAGATVAKSAAEACQEAEMVFSMLANDEAVEALVFGGEGIATGLSAQGIHVSCSTISVRLAKKLASEHAKAGQRFLSSPVFGRPEAAAARKLLIIVAGEPGLIETVRPPLEGLGRGVFIAGTEPWQANLFKLCGNFMLASMVETFGEALATLRKAGANDTQFYEVISELFGSPIYKNYGKLILEGNYEPAAFALKLGFKDLRLMLEAAQDVSTPMPIGSIIRDQFLSALAHGQENLDWSSVAKVAARNAGLDS